MLTKFLDLKKSLVLVSAAGVFAILLSSPFANASGPQFNIFPIAYDGAQDTDYPLLDGRNFSRGEAWSTSQSDHDAGIQASAGEIIEFSVYYHNGAPDLDENVAINTVIEAYASPGLGTSASTHRISGSIRADNASPIYSSQKGGDINVYISGNELLSLSLVPGSVIWYPDRASRTIQLPDEIFNGTSIGDIRGCWEYAGFVNFKLQVSQATPPPQPGQLGIQKQVRNYTTGTAFEDTEVGAKPSETVEYRIRVSATNNSVENVYVKDAMDSRLTLTGSVTVDGVEVSAPAFFSSSGVNIGTVSPSTNREIRFKAVVAPSSQFTSSGTYYLTNTATAFTVNQSVQDSANVRVGVQVLSPYCTYTWDQPWVSSTDQRGLRKVGDEARVSEQVVGLQPNQSFNLVNKHLSGSPIFRSAVRANSSGVYDVYDRTVIPSGYIAGDYTSYIEVNGQNVANCKGFQIQAQQVQATRDLTITKLVKNITDVTGFSSSVAADPGERVQFQITFTTTGNASQNNVILRDIINDSRLTFISGSMRLDGSPVSNETALFSSGINLGTQNANVIHTVIFDATVAGSSSFMSGTTALPNTGYVRSDQVAEKSSIANVNVTAAVAATRDLTINKLVKNITDVTGFSSSVAADPGERVQFQITFTTTGNASQNNVTIRDFISDSRLTWISGTVRLDGVILSSSQEAALFGSGLNLGTQNPNVTHTVIFDANVASSGFTSGIVTTMNNFAIVNSSEVTNRQAMASVSVTVGPAPAYDLNIQKLVKNVNDNTSFSTSVPADPGERVQFQITLTTTGNASQTNVILRDVISDSRLSFVSGSMRLDNNPVSNETALFGSGLNLGTLSANTTKTLIFDATVAGSSSFPSGTTTTLPNTGFGRSDQVAEKSSTANVNVTVAVAASRGLTIQKQVQNVSDGTGFSTSVAADPNERVRFQIVFSTTGNAQQTNVIIRDLISDSRLTFLSGTMYLDSSLVGGSEVNLFGSGINLGTQNPNVSHTLIFDAQVAGSSSFNQGVVTTLNNFGLVSSNEVASQQAQASVTVTVGTAPARDLSITKLVRNINKGTGFATSVSADPGDRVQFQIIFSTTGNALQNNVIVRDILPSQLTFQSGTMRIDGSAVANEFELFSGGRNFGTLSPNTSKIITFEALLASAGSFSGSTTLTNSANVSSSEVGTKFSEARIFVSTVLGTGFQIRKTAFNQTQSVDATTVPANSGDSILYTLYYRNIGGTTITNVLIEDDIRDVLELARLTNTGGAVVDNNIIKYPRVDVVAGVEISRTFQVVVRPVSEFPATSDLFMVNIYGNEIRVQVRKPQVLGQPPRTGASEWLAVGLAGLVTAGYWIHRRKSVVARLFMGILETYPP